MCGEGGREGRGGGLPGWEETREDTKSKRIEKKNGTTKKKKIATAKSE